jgi:5-methylcytosine-specific restriction endonuclease McrA
MDVHQERFSGKVLVLNAGYEPLQVVSVRHALSMLHREVAVIEEAIDGQQIGPWPVPRILRLVRYVATKWLRRPMRWSRWSVMVRDNHACAYCGKDASTIDHIVPVSRGGRSTYENTVAACLACNARKGAHTPQEVHMRLLVTPRTPTYAEVMKLPVLDVLQDYFATPA